MAGAASYDQPSYHFEGRFAKGLPCGPCAFTCSSAFRSAGLPPAAGSFVTAPQGPTLRGAGAYALPPGLDGGERAAGGDEAGDGAADGEEADALLPAWPAYEGLGYAASPAPPRGAPDMPFPPPAAALAAL